MRDAPEQQAAELPASSRRGGPGGTVSWCVQRSTAYRYGDLAWRSTVCACESQEQPTTHPQQRAAEAAPTRLGCNSELVYVCSTTAELQHYIPHHGPYIFRSIQRCSGLSSRSFNDAAVAVAAAAAVAAIAPPAAVMAAPMREHGVQENYIAPAQLLLKLATCGWLRGAAAAAVVAPLDASCDGWSGRQALALQ